MARSSCARDGLLARYDAVIIGSGAGGATLAYQLGRNGLKVLIAERGERLQPQVGLDTRNVGRFLYHEVKASDEYLSFVGGQTKFYGAALYRFRESDFDEVQHESGVSPSWPISYADLEAYYDQAEGLYRVHGSPEGDPSEPPRSRPYPYERLPQDPLVERIAQRLRRSGIQVAAIPRGLDYGTGGKCIMCATCDAHYCQLDAKMDAETAALGQAVSTGNVSLESGVECLRILTDPAGTKAAGVELLHHGAATSIKCPIVAVCAGLPGSAILLRKSRTDKHKEGLGNSSGVLGRYLGGHAVGMVFPLVSVTKIPQAHTKDFSINGFYNGAPGWNYPLGIIQTGGQTPFWELAGPLKRPFAKFVGQRSITCFYMSEALPTSESGFVFDGDSVARKIPPTYNMKSFRQLREIAKATFAKAGYPCVARPQLPYLWHETGTARMGDEAANSVVDRNCQVHGIDGLFVMDASVLPTAGAVNTGLTIMALALRAGDHIAKCIAPITAVEQESV